MRLTLKSSCLYFMFKVDRSIGCKLHWQRRRRLQRRQPQHWRWRQCGVHGALADSGHKTKQLSDFESKESDVLRVCIICILIWCSTFPLVFCCCKLSHVIFLKLSNFTKWQPFLMKRKTRTILSDVILWICSAFQAFLSFSAWEKWRNSTGNRQKLKDM